MKRLTLWTAAGLALSVCCLAADKDGWVSMFDGKTLNGWKASQNPEAWSVRDGAITGDGEVSHLFWMAQECENCEFRAEVKISHGGNSGMYFRTAFGPGFPKGYEAQVNTSHTDPVKTGSLYNFHKIFEQLIPDDTWGTQHIIADGNHIVIKVNDKVVTDYVDTKNTFTKGFCALQQHNKGSVVQYRNLMFRPLPPK
jgi:3-keto-disaccharide hydrolase